MLMAGYENKRQMNSASVNGTFGVTLHWDHSSQFHGTVHTATLAVCTVLVIFVLILGTFGNGMVLLSALHCRRLRSNFNVLVFNLAGADFIVCLCLSPTFLFLLFSDPPSPREFCGGFLFASTTCGLMSLLTLVAIAVHRQTWLRGRMRSALTARRTAVILVTIYTVVLSVSVAGTLHVLFAWTDSSSHCQFVMNSSDIKSNNVVLFFIAPVATISCIVIIASYLAVARAVRTQTYLRVKALQPLLKPVIYRPSQGVTNTEVPASDFQQTPVYEGAPATKKSAPLRHCSCCNCMAALDKENKAVTMCFVVIIIITLCWAPLIVSHFIELITGESIILYQVKLCGIALVFLNSALDPYMYSQSSGRLKQRYKRFFWDIVRCDCHLPQGHRFMPFSTRSANTKTMDNPVAAPQNCAAVQFLQPKNKNLNSLKARDICSDNKAADSKLTKLTYTNNILMYGAGQLAGSQVTQCGHRDMKKPLAQNVLINDVRSLVHKSCCHRHSAEHLSLIES